MAEIYWVLESSVFPSSHGDLRRSVREAGHRLVDWEDHWWNSGVPKSIPESNVVFHGSLGNAARVFRDLSWSPGGYCDTDAFRCSSWYPQSADWLLHTKNRILPAIEFVENAEEVARSLTPKDQVFVRPDCPLKPFSGRVLAVSEVSLRALDHGFYFEDEKLPIVVCPVVNVGREWRFVIVGGQVIAGSAYLAETRSAVAGEPASEPWQFAQKIAASLNPPADVYVLDVCESDGELRLLELNPFGGADLYACDSNAIVSSITEWLRQSKLC